MVEPRIDSIRLHFRSGSPRRTLREGDEKYVKGVLMVRQQMSSFGRLMISQGRPVWEWVVWGSDRDRNYQTRARYRTKQRLLKGEVQLIDPPPAGWKIIESGRPVPEGSMVFIEGWRETDFTGWRLIDTSKGERFGMEATYEGERRAFAIPMTKNEILRNVFETVCTCKLRKQPISVSANVAVKKYSARCKCGINPGAHHASTD